MSDRDERLEQLLDEYEDRLAAGETPDLGDYRTRHPDLYAEFEVL